MDILVGSAAQQICFQTQRNLYRDWGIGAKGLDRLAEEVGLGDKIHRIKVGLAAGWVDWLVVAVATVIVRTRQAVAA